MLQKSAPYNKFKEVITNGIQNLTKGNSTAICSKHFVVKDTTLENTNN